MLTPHQHSSKVQKPTVTVRHQFLFMYPVYHDRLQFRHFEDRAPDLIISVRTSVVDPIKGHQFVRNLRPVKQPILVSVIGPMPTDSTL